MIKSFLKYAVSLSLFLSSTISLAQVALEEMVVTSQKREQNLLDVPSALQAFSGDMLDGAGVRDTDDLVNMIPDMLMSGEDQGRANIWLRGIGSTKFDIGSEGSNAFFIDEVYMPRNQSILTGLVDLERVEVLKGPQGTLYGRNALGGAISIFYKKPTSEFEQRIKVGAGDNGQEKFSYLLSGQLADGLFGRMILSYQDDDGVHRDNTFPGDTGPANENYRFSLFGEGNDYEWSLTVDNSISKDDAMVSEAIICPRNDTAVCTTAQRNLIQPTAQAAAGGLDIFVTDFAKSSAYALSGGDAAALQEIRSDKYSSNLSEDTFGRREDSLIAAKFKAFRDDYDLTLLVSTNQNQSEELKDFDSTKAKSFVQGSEQKTNQSSFEIRWNSKPEDEIQWVAGIYSFLDYGDRQDIFRTGPDSVFNQQAVLATALVDLGLFSYANLTTATTPGYLNTYTPDPTKSALVSTYKVATGGTTYNDYGTAGLLLNINNKSSAAFGQVTIPMADRWNITLGARYTYDVKGMTYTTSSNSIGIPHSLVVPEPTATNDATLYSAETLGKQALVQAAAVKASPVLTQAPGWQTCDYDMTKDLQTESTEWLAANASLIGSVECNTNFAILANAQGIGIAPIADASQVFEVNKESSWTSTDPKMTIDFKPNANSMVWYTYSTGFKAGGWQFANYFRELVEQGFDPEELEMNEIGYKGSFLNGSLNLSAVAYNYDWTDKQTIKVSVVNGLPIGLTRNAGESSINGLDLNLIARVADQTTINFNYAYIDAQYDVYCDDSRDWSDVHGSFTSCKAGTVGAYSRVGGKMPWTPDNSLVLSVEHVEPTRIGDVIIATSYSHKTNVGNADERVAGLTLLDEIARLSFSTTIEFNNGTSLRGYCTNCLDVDDDIGFTLLYPNDQGGGARVKYYEGMRAGLEVIHRF